MSSSESAAVSSSGTSGTFPTQQNEVVDVWTRINKLFQLHSFQPVDIADKKHLLPGGRGVWLDKSSSELLLNNLLFVFKDVDLKQALLQRILPQGRSLSFEEPIPKESRSSSENAPHLAKKNIEVAESRRPSRWPVEPKGEATDGVPEEKPSDDWSKQLSSLLLGSSSSARTLSTGGESMLDGSCSKCKDTFHLYKVASKQEVQLYKAKKLISALQKQNTRLQTQLAEHSKSNQRIRTTTQPTPPPPPPRSGQALGTDEKAAPVDSKCSEYHLKQCLFQIGAVLEAGSAQQLLLPLSYRDEQAHLDSVMRTLYHVVSQRKHIEEIARLSSELVRLVAPWCSNSCLDRPSEMTGPVPMSDCGAMEKYTSSLRGILDEVRQGPLRVQRDHKDLTPEEEHQLVGHLGTLFRVHHPRNLYSAAHLLHSRHLELRNALRAIKSYLDLDESCSLSNVLDCVCEVSKARHLIGLTDLERVIANLETYAEFFESFHSVASELMRILGVSTLEETVGCVRALVHHP